MKIAVLHWATSSVGGINTTLQILREEALARGDELYILASDSQKTKVPHLLIERKRVRGGDTFLTIDGYAPHHPSNVWATLAFIKREKFDLVITSFLCPHPTKAYGKEPLFMPLLEGIAEAGIPIVGYVHDAYWSTYSAWGEKVLPLCRRTMVAQKAYGEPLEALGHPVTTAYLPFTPFVGEPTAQRDDRLVSWIPQWKNIKGIKKFWEGLPRAQDLGLEVRLYGNGIEYYNMRKKPDWKQLVGTDHFAPNYSGTGHATFYGCVHENEIPGVLTRSAFMVDFQGSGKPKYEPYTKGSYNHTVIEALYYGCVPVVHTNMLKSSIPSELLLAIDDPTQWPEAVASFDLSGYDREAARRYVIENHSAAKLYDLITQP